MKSIVNTNASKNNESGGKMASNSDKTSCLNTSIEICIAKRKMLGETKANQLINVRNSV